MKRVTSFGLAAALTMASFATFAAEPPTPEQQAHNAVLTRQGVFKLIAFYFGPVGGMMANRVPFDAATVQKNAPKIEALAGMIPDVFANDTRKFHANEKTGALDGVWNSQADFKAKADDLVKAANALGAAAKGGDQKATLDAARAVGKACSGCHDNYRQKS